VPRRDLVARTGYQQKQVRVAVRRLAALGLIEVEGDSGTTARYRLTSRTLGRPWGATPPASTRVASPPPAPAPPRPAPMPAATVTGSDSAGVQIVLGGVAITVAPGAGFEVAPGMTARAELDPDGRPRLVLRPSDPPG
jgi:hypothetical protein